MKSRNTYGFMAVIFISIGFFSCQEQPAGPDPGPVTPPKQIISVERAKEFYDTYTERRSAIIREYEDSISTDSSKFMPTRYAEYDLATIKQYISFIEQEAKDANVKVKTLRFYLSNYPNSSTFPNGDAVKYPRKNSIFIVPTMDQNGENVGFAIQEIQRGQPTAVPIRDIIGDTIANGKGTATVLPKKVMNEAGFFMANSTTVQGMGTQSLVLDDGNIGPPPPHNDFGGN
jgi:hypothetical protein